MIAKRNFCKKLHNEQHLSNYHDPKHQNQISKKKLQRIILWFNLSKSNKTEIGKYFLQLIKKHFLQHHKFYNFLTKTL